MSRSAPLACRHCQASHSLVESVRRLASRVCRDQFPDEDDVFRRDDAAAVFPLGFHLSRIVRENFLERKPFFQIFSAHGAPYRCGFGVRVSRGQQ